MATVTRAQTAWTSLFRSPAALAWSHVAASAWLLVGLHLDGWAHAHRPGLESFFTPWHGILYTGFGALGLLILLTWSANGRTLPAGYAMSGVGALVFLAGGVGDMLWHTFLGIEVNVEALLSPTHLMLAVGMALMVAGPLRAATRATVPALLSAALLLSVFAFFTQFLQPGGRPWPLAGNQPTAPILTVASVAPDYPVFPGGVPTREIAAILGIGGILVATALVIGVALYLVRRFELAPGAFTLVLGASGALLALERGTLWWLGVTIVAGIAMDALAAIVKPRAAPWRQHAFAGASAAALWSTYFLALALVGGVWWSVHLWTGAIAMAALGAVALSVLSSVRHEPLG